MRIALVLVFVASCAAPAPASAPVAAPPPPPAPRNPYTDAQAAFAAGSVIDAVVLLRKVPDSAPEYAKARAQLSQLAAKAEKLINKLLVRSDEAMGDGSFQRAINILTDLQSRVGPDKKPDVDKKLQIAHDKLAAAKQEYDDKLKRGRDRLRGGDAREAYRLLTRAADLAADDAFTWGFPEVQLLEQARIESPKVNQRAAAQHESEARRKRRQIPENEMIVGSVDTFASQEQEITRLKNTRDLVDKARDYKKKGMLYEAIITLEEARAKDPDSPAVKLGLDGMEDDRSRLVDGYLEVADRYFAKQELEAAVPYFRRVLRLEPDNLRAKEAVQMYQNLEKIKQERTQSQ